MLPIFSIEPSVVSTCQYHWVTKWGFWLWVSAAPPMPWTQAWSRTKRSHPKLKRNYPKNPPSLKTPSSTCSVRKRKVQKCLDRSHCAIVTCNRDTSSSNKRPCCDERSQTSAIWPCTCGTRKYETRCCNAATRPRARNPFSNRSSSDRALSATTETAPSVR